MSSLPTRIPGVRIATNATAIGDTNPTAEVQPTTFDFSETVNGDMGLTSQPACPLARRATRTIECEVGEIFAVAVDLRRWHATFGHWQSFYLSAKDQRQLTIPAGVALGWQVLAPTSQVLICSTVALSNTPLSWLSWDDPQLQIVWPETPLLFAAQDEPAQDLASMSDHQLPQHLARIDKRSPKRTTIKNSSQHYRPKLGRRMIPKPIRSSHAEVRLPNSVIEKKAVDKTSKGSRLSRSEAQGPILILGSNGRLGSALAKSLREIGTVVEASRDTDPGCLWPATHAVDVGKPASLRALIRDVRPALIVNATALTDIDQAEQSPRLAQLVNANAPAIMAEEAREIGAAIIHFCSDMVFDGQGQEAYRESDVTEPLNHYARTKLLGTQAIQGSEVPHLILRCGWLYASSGENYVRSMIDLMTYRHTLTFPANYCGTPTNTDWIASTVNTLLLRSDHDFVGWLAEHGGLYHLSPRGYASRAEVAHEVWRQCQALKLPLALRQIDALPLAELPAIAPIPANCRLNPSLFGRSFGIELPSWQEQMLSQLATIVRLEKSAKLSA